MSQMRKETIRFLDDRKAGVRVASPFVPLSCSQHTTHSPWPPLASTAFLKRLQCSQSCSIVDVRLSIFYNSAMRKKSKQTFACTFGISMMSSENWFLPNQLTARTNSLCASLWLVSQIKTSYLWMENPHCSKKKPAVIMYHHCMPLQTNYSGASPMRHCYSRPPKKHLVNIKL